jgi:hypothetical protein
MIRPVVDILRVIWRGPIVLTFGVGEVYANASVAKHAVRLNGISCPRTNEHTVATVERNRIREIDSGKAVQIDAGAGRRVGLRAAHDTANRVLRSTAADLDSMRTVAHYSGASIIRANKVAPHDIRDSLGSVYGDSCPRVASNNVA